MVLLLAFCVLAPLLDVSSKLAAAAIPVGQITAARFVVQGALMLPVVLVMRLSWRVSPMILGLVSLRALFLIVSTYGFVAAVAVMPIADALAIVFFEPFIVMIVGHFLFGDSVGPRRIGASVVAFAAYMLVTRAISAAIHPVTMQLHTSIAGVVLCLSVLVLAQGIFWLWLFGVGFWAALSHICMTYALKFAPSATLAPLQYLEIIVAVALGYLVFGDFPNALTWAGIVLIVASGLYLIYREQVVARRLGPRTATASPPPAHPAPHPAGRVPAPPASPARQSAG